MQWRPTSGRGHIATFSIVRRAPSAALSDEAPYAVAFIALEEGVRLFGNIVGAPADSLRIGMPVRCGFEAAQDPALRVPVFTPDEGAR
jgi:uncharacterized protein